MNSYHAEDFSAAQMLLRMEWLLELLPDLPYPYILTTVMHPKFESLRSLEPNRQELYGEVKRLISSLEHNIEIDEEIMITIKVLEQSASTKTRRNGQDKRLMLGMRQHVDNLLKSGYEINRDQMTIFRGQKTMTLSHGVLVEE